MEPRDYDLMKRTPSAVVYKLTEMGYEYANDYITIPMIEWKVKGIFYKRSGSIANNSGTYIIGFGKSHSLEKEVHGDEGMHEYVAFYEYRFEEPGYIEVDGESIAFRYMLLEKFLENATQKKRKSRIQP